jgi:hypothetical protein
MSYASVLNTQTISNKEFNFNSAGLTKTLETIYSTTLTGRYLYTVSYKITSASNVNSADMRVANARVVYDPKSKDFTRTLSGVVSTGLFEVKQMYDQDTDNYVQIRLLKLL